MKKRIAAVLAGLLAATPASAQQEEPSAPTTPSPTTSPSPSPSTSTSTSTSTEKDATISGSVVDIETGTPLPNTTIEVVSGGSGKVKTDASGRFKIALPPGRYDLRVYFPIYQLRRLRRVELEAGDVVRVDLKLRPSAEAIEEVIIEAAPETRSEAGLLIARRKSTGMSDGVSAQEMSRGGDSSASDAVKRVVSATVEDGRYVYIRGLGDRYVTALINGAPMPSPEPDRQAVPLDLFPSSLLASLTIEKTYQPWNPGAFGGGTVQIETTSYPRDLTLSVKAGGSADTSATGRDRLTYEGGSLDALGFDDGSRSLPGAVPSGQPLRVGDGLDKDQMETIGESFANVWTLDETATAPNLTLGASLGDTVKIAGKELGYVTALSFGRALDVKETTIRKVNRPAEELEIREEMTSTVGSEVATLGALAAGGLRPHPDHDIDAVFLYAHAGEATAQRVEGVSESDNIPIVASRLGFNERQLTFGQATWRARLPAHLQLRSQANVGLTTRDEPDTRDIVYQITSEGDSRLKTGGGSGERFFGALEDLTFGGSADLEAPVGPLTLRAGGAAQRWSRTFSGRRFNYKHVANDPSALFLPPETIFDTEHVGPDFRLEERTAQTDQYDAALSVLGGYGAVEARVGERLRVLAGARVERSQQELTPGSPFAIGEADSDDAIDRGDTDILPAASGTLAIGEGMNLRAAYSYTLARPMFRELAPFFYFDYARRQGVSGNPDLQVTRIHNADLRWEQYIGDADLIAAGVFYKRFIDPIEEVIYTAAGGDTTFANAPRGTAMGAEMEARLSLGRLHHALDSLRAFGNLTLLRSRVELAEDQVMSQTNASRALQGQSPYVGNVGLTWAAGRTDAAVLFNVIGARIVEVGFETLPDTYERPLPRLDVGFGHGFTDELKLKLSGKNLLARPVSYTAGGIEVYRFDPGVSFGASLEWTPALH